ncbi:peptidylprolyl isomerase [Planococcus sp. NCCP-2050]|uniref:peptidylprolyl isomerase n=1 Tax=Planococcus sp. NCCP-2050 TaxID=2944679 RepID=UPI002082E168|nr:peptidylprolyl isomerase [Planococcus sp. NCCP-2050]GKW47378.1 peptidyl-prolyl cis-trans isomerase [Planococcus sp. NCCP-2050]
MKMKIALLILLAAVLTACSSGGETAKQKEEPKEAETSSDTASESQEEVELPQLSNEVAEGEALVEMKTSMGTMKIKLFPEHAPKAVENFLTHAEEGYYEGITFHRVMNEFMIQGGDPTGTGGGGESIYGENFEDEFSKNLYNFRGALSMANAGPGTNGSQFFIVQATAADPNAFNEIHTDQIRKAYEELGGTPWLDGKHTVFGQVIEGLETVDAIAAVETAEADKPVEDVIIESIEVLEQ